MIRAARGGAGGPAVLRSRVAQVLQPRGEGTLQDAGHDFMSLRRHVSQVTEEQGGAIGGARKSVRV